MQQAQTNAPTHTTSHIVQFKWLFVFFFFNFLFYVYASMRCHNVFSIDRIKNTFTKIKTSTHKTKETWPITTYQTLEAKDFLLSYFLKTHT